MENNNKELNGVKKMIADGIVTQEAAEKYFPELKESEDEKILRVLKEGFEIYNKGEWYGGITNEQILAWLEKQGEQKTLCDKCRKEHPSHSCQDITELGRCALEKQNEQKPGVKIKPKFHEGEWVILTAGELSTTLQIGKVDTDKKLYWFNDDSYLPVVDEECLHRWTIQDAKAGDVLVDGNLPFIFKKIDTNKHIYAYCGISVDSGFKIESDGESGEWTWMQDIKPATKEQRYFLFAKMREAGYEWDAEKKELKKIEHKPAAWSEERNHRQPKKG